MMSFLLARPQHHLFPINRVWFSPLIFGLVALLSQASVLGFSYRKDRRLCVLFLQERGYFYSLARGSRPAFPGNSFPGSFTTL